MGELRAKAQDVVTLSQRKIDPVTGFLTAPARIATVGIQVYTARDIGLEGKPDENGRPMPGDRVLRLLRAEDAVFDPTSMQSFEGAPVTFKHPPKLQNVDATNWRMFSVGDQYGVARDGDYLAVQRLTIRDAAAVKAVDVDGTSELSCGYDFDVVLTPGRTADGREYDGRMTNIRGNHTAIVDRGRAGPGCRVADEDDNPQGARRMANLIPKPIDGVTVELDAQTMSIVERALADRDKQITTLVAARDSAEKRATTAEAEIVTLKNAATAAVTAHDAKVKELEGKVQTQEAFDQAVEGRLVLITDALRVHDGLQPAGKSNDLIVTEVLTAVVARDEDVKGAVTAFLGGQEIAKAAPAARAAAFRAAVAMTKRRAQDGAGGGEGGSNGGGQGGGDGRDARGNDSIRRAFDAALVPESPGGGGGGTARDGGPRREGEVRESNAATGRDEYIERTTTSWRQPVEQPGTKARDGAAQ
jgi:hypothetical protein